ncbi:MAG: T9SS type A sorting domain-containing protein [Chitinophagales bacterium]|nr:T9SS type A sorting domain-containing protein [Chitinophagales bacterium]
MKKLMSVLFLITFFIPAQRAVSQAAQPSFTLFLEEITYEDWPGIHSFAYGTWDERWIIVCGRVDGLHAFLPPNPFPVSDANHFIRMVDPQTGEQWNKSIYDLPLEIANQLRSTNPQYFQRDNYLYVIGGYGKDSLSGDKITFPSLIAIDLEMLSDVLINELDPAPAFRKLDDTIFQVTGGEIEVFNDRVFLFGGHVFTGDYTKPASPSFTQKYTNEVRTFLLGDDGITLSVSDIDILYDSILFHRRDLNFEPVLYAGEEKGLAAYSGVFQYDGDFPWLYDIYFHADGTYAQNEECEHRFNNYTCPVMNVFDSASNTMYTTFFGGISQYYFDETDSVIDSDLNIPFVNDITTMVRYADGSCEQIVMPLSFDGLLGSNAIFQLNDEMAHYDNNIIKLHVLDGEYEAGYIYGGIQAFIPNFTPSIASNKLYKVKINYTPPEPAEIAGYPDRYIKVFPNPVRDRIDVQNNSADIISEIMLTNSYGKIVYHSEKDIGFAETEKISVAGFANGIYFLQVIMKHQTVIKKIVVE